MSCTSVQKSVISNSWFPKDLFVWPPYKQAQRLAQALHNTQRANPDESLIKKARIFVKKHPKDTPQINELKRELLAVKLKIEASVFDSNLGFEQFAQENHLDRYLLHYGHTIKVDEHNKIFLRLEGSQQPWDTIKSKISQKPSPKAVPSLPWIYGQHGIQQKDMYNWERVEPYKWEDPSLWNNQYIFEFCVCCGDRPHFVGDHSWFRLKTPEGAVYSVGLYRPQKRNWRDSLYLPLRTKKGYLMQPDITEFWPCEIQTVEMAITEKQFFAIKKKIEKDKKENKLIFRLFGGNCTMYTASIAKKILGIELETSSSIPKAWLPKKVFSCVEKPFSYLPHPIQKAISIILVVFTNTIFLLFGITVVDKAAKGASPYIKSFRDLFDSEKCQLHHPHIVGTRMRDDILAWRKQEAAKCTSEKERQKIRFAVPKKASPIKNRNA
jgi:hypothetical protein